MQRSFYIRLLLVFALLFAQQGAVLHELGHILGEQTQQDKQTPHSVTCEQCVTYAQLGSTLNSTINSIAIISAPAELATPHTRTFLSTYTLTATARGPPALQKIA